MSSSLLVATICKVELLPKRACSVSEPVPCRNYFGDFLRDSLPVSMVLDRFC
jgi:hypothetical protein